jgi:hypothetical protein
VTRTRFAVAEFLAQDLEVFDQQAHAQGEHGNARPQSALQQSMRKDESLTIPVSS